MTESQQSGGLSPIGPDAVQVEAVRQTWFGSWIGRATALVLMVVAYLGALGLVLKFFWEDYAAVRAQEPVLFWALLAAPLAFILLFSVLPEAIRLWRDRRLKAAALVGSMEPGYFRLRPYEERDRSAFRRDDGAQEEVLSWIRAAEEPLLYLTGSSGSGKSSLLNASVLPSLRELGWRVIALRSFADPETTLLKALEKPGAVWGEPPQGAGGDLRALLERASGHLEAGGERLMVVLDQFEEFIILHDEERRTRFAAFLQGLVAQPLPGATLLLVMRSDYTTLVRKLGLPRLHDGENWYEVSPFLRSAAEAFLRRSGTGIADPTMERIIKGLSEIEERPGLFRPITLNMLGLVLARAGGRLEADPERLIQRYLQDCLREPELRDDAPRILAPMITEAGTKRPCSETELTAATGLDSWRIGGCLVRLDHLGLVRPLDQARERWEIAHDFLARLLGQLLGRLRPPLWRRVLPYTAPVLLVLWAVTLLLALPSWQEREYLLARRALADLGVDVTPADDRAGDMVKFPYRREDSSTKLPIGDDWLAAAIPKLNVIQPPVLDLSGTGVTDLGPLAGFSGLERLDLSSTGVTDLGPLAELSDLEWLDLSNTGVTDLGPLAKLSVLEELFLRNMVLDDDVVLGGLGGSYGRFEGTGVLDLGPLAGLSGLERLKLSDTGVTDLGPLAGLSRLEWLDLSDTRVTDLGPLAELDDLEMLHLRDMSMGRIDLSPLAGLEGLKQLYIRYRDMFDLSPLAGLNDLEVVEAGRDTR